MVSEDELEAIHTASLQILEEMGMDFMHEARAGHPRKPGPM
jgi:trimethylamine:corrinoid methyltransferase-like protein